MQVVRHNGDAVGDRNRLIGYKNVPFFGGAAANSAFVFIIVVKRHVLGVHYCVVNREVEWW